MLSLVLIGLIVYAVGYKIIPFKVDLKNESINKPRMKKKPYIYDAKNYVEYIGGVEYIGYGITGYLFVGFITALLFALVGGYSELLCADIQLGIIQSGMCAILGFFVYPLIGAIYITCSLNTREEDKKKYRDLVLKYISWEAKDEEFIAADCFFCNIIIDGSVPEDELNAIKNYRNRCRKNVSMHIAETAEYYKALNSVREKMGLKPSYGEMIKRAAVAAYANGQPKVEVVKSDAAKSQSTQPKPKYVEPKHEKTTPKKETLDERKYRAVWERIAQATDDSTILFERELGGKLEYLESFFRGVYRIDDKKNVCHSGGYTNPEFPYFILGFATARKIYPDKVRTKLTYSNDMSNRQLLASYAKTVAKLLTHEVKEVSIKSKIELQGVEQIINSYRYIPSESGAFELRGGYAQNIPNEFRGFILGYYAGTYRIKKEDLANMCWSWEIIKKLMTSESKDYSSLTPQGRSAAPVTQKQRSPYTYERKEEPDYVEIAKGRVADTDASNPKSNYGVIAKQMVEGSDPYGAIWSRMKNDIGISDARFKRRLTRNTSHLENMYRKQRGVPVGRELFNRRGYVDDDFFAFMLGYILADYLFDADDKLVAEAATRSSSEFEVEPEYDEVNSWEYEGEESWDESSSDDYDSDVFNSDDFSSDDYNHDEFDFDELEFMEPWERCQALEDAGLDPDDFDFDDDFGSSDDDATFRNDYVFEGDDMYSFDGEFIE